MNKIALLVLYNHRYDKNIPIIEELYKGKFSYVFHIIPFYDGDKENVIPVYESSYYFQSYIAQAYQHIKKMGFTHFFVVADDMILNPQITEENLFTITGIPTDSCFINDIREIYDWPNLKFEFEKYRVKQNGVEVENVLPSKEVAKDIFIRNGLRTEIFSARNFYELALTMLKVKRLRKFFKTIFDFVRRKNKMDFPLVWGYSDILLLTAEIMPKFCSYCGAFAATNLFVEYAIPTALAFSTDKITHIKDIKMKGITQMYPAERMKFVKCYDLRNQCSDSCMNQTEFETNFQKSLSKLLSEYPENTFFIHPIKLSKWK